MTVEQLIEELSRFNGDLEVRVVDRNAGWSDGIWVVIDEHYGIAIELEGVKVTTAAE